MKTTNAFAPARSASSMRFRKSASSFLLKLDVLVLDGKVVDAALGRRDPAGHLAGLDHALHQGMDEGPVGLRGDPLREILFILFFRNCFSVRSDRLPGPGADRAAETRRGQGEAQGVAGALDGTVPAFQADLAVL